MKLNIPSKMKNFLWRSCRNFLPTSARLRDRGVPCSSYCAVCASSIENTCHLFFSCPHAVNYWNEVNMWSCIVHRMESCDDFSSLFFMVLDDLSIEKRSLFASILWSLWKNRNETIWESSNKDPKQTLWRAKEVLNEWIWYRSK